MGQQSVVKSGRRTDLSEPVAASAPVPAEDPRVAAAVPVAAAARGPAGGAAGRGGGSAVVVPRVERRTPELDALEARATGGGGWWSTRTRA
jgi:hypothetical protein